VLDLFVPSQGVLPAEGLFVVANLAPSLLAGGVVNCVLMPCQIVMPGEYCVARLAGRRIDPRALVWARNVRLWNVRSRCHSKTATQA